MIGKTNVGGGVASSAWAYIGVIYPQGSTCTATNGVITLTADGTSGLYVFGVPEPLSTPETWTVSCTDGTRTKSATVDISTEYQNSQVRLSYGRLPFGYQEVEYLESSGTQYIDTGLAMEFGENYEYDLDFMLLNASSLYAGGAWYTDGTYGYYYLNFTCGGYGSAISHRWRYNTTQVPFNMSFNTPSTEPNVRYAVKFLGEGKNAYLNDSLIGSISTGGSSSVPNYNPYLFGINGGSGVTNRGSVRIYDYVRKNSSTDEEYQHLVPCYRTSDNVAGMYDLVSNTFLTNAGTGAFVLGPDV